MQFKKQSFTLVELLIVIAIIGILSAAVIFGVKRAVDNSRDARRKQDIGMLRTALEAYYADKGQYPPSGGATFPNSGWTNSSDTSWDTLQSALAPYLPQLPKDPLNESGGWAGSGKYNYDFYSLNYGCSQGWYMLVYKLNNPDITSLGITACNGQLFNYAGTITQGSCPACN